MSYLAVATAVVGITTGIINGSNDAKKNHFANVQAQLDAQRKNDLDKATLKVNNDNAKLKILADSYSNIRASQQQTLMTAKSLQEQTDKKNLVILGIGGGVIVIGAIAVLKLA
jgi:Na+/glutamate symporter